MRQPLRYVPPKNYDILETHPKIFTKPSPYVPRRLKIRAESKLRQMRNVYEPLSAEELQELRAERLEREKMQIQSKQDFSKAHYFSSGAQQYHRPVRVKVGNSQSPQIIPMPSPLLNSAAPAPILRTNSLPRRRWTPQPPQPWTPQRQSAKPSKKLEPSHEAYLKFLVEVTSEIIMKRIFDDHRILLFLVRYIDERGRHLKKDKLLPMINLMLKEVGITGASALYSQPSDSFKLSERGFPEFECTPRGTSKVVNNEPQIVDTSLTSVDIDNILRDNYDYLLKRGFKDPGPSDVRANVASKGEKAKSVSSSSSKSSKSSTKEKSEKSKISTKSEKSETTPYSDFESDQSEISVGLRSPVKFDLKLAQKSREKFNLEQDRSLAESLKSDTVPSEPNNLSDRSGFQIQEIPEENPQAPETPKKDDEDELISENGDLEPEQAEISDASAVPPDPGATVELLEATTGIATKSEESIDEKIDKTIAVDEILNRNEHLMPDSPLPDREPPLVPELHDDSPKATQSAPTTPVITEILTENDKSSPKKDTLAKNTLSDHTNFQAGPTPAPRKSLTLLTETESDDETSTDSSLNSEEIAEMLTQTSTYLQLLQEGYMRDDTPLDVIAEEDEEELA